MITTTKNIKLETISSGQINADSAAPVSDVMAFGLVLWQYRVCRFAREKGRGPTVLNNE